VVKSPLEARISALCQTFQLTKVLSTAYGRFNSSLAPEELQHITTHMDRFLPFVPRTGPIIKAESGSTSTIKWK
jgi:hypothetical protein